MTLPTPTIQTATCQTDRCVPPPLARRPSPPAPPPPLAECIYDCEWGGVLTNGVNQKFCSDGGVNSYPYGFDNVTGVPLFGCEYGHQCSECSTRSAEVTDLCSDSCRPDVMSSNIIFKGQARNGICEDGGSREAWMLIADNGTHEGFQYHFKAGCGYGTDCTDCGRRSPSLSGRRLQMTVTMNPFPPPSPPSPPPPIPPPATPPPSPPPSPGPPPLPPGSYSQCKLQTAHPTPTRRT